MNNFINTSQTNHPINYTPVKKIKVEKLDDDVKTLDFNKLSPFSDDELINLSISKSFEKNQHTETVIFPENSDLSYHTLLLFLHSSPIAHLKEIQIYNCRNISHQEYVALQKAYPKIQFYFFAPIPPISSAKKETMLIHMVQSLKGSPTSVPFISFSHITDLDKSDLDFLAEELRSSFSYLQGIDFRGCKKVKHQDIGKFEEKITSKKLHQQPVYIDGNYKEFLEENSDINPDAIRTLCVSPATKMSKNEFIKVLTSAKNLEEFIVESSAVIDDEILSYLPSSIEYLEVQNCPKVLGNFIHCLPTKHPLTLFIAYCNNITFTNLMAISKLDLNQLIIEDSENVNDRILMNIKTMKNLIILTLKNCPYITDKGLTSLLKANPNLSSIDISENPKLTDTVLSPMLRMPKLAALYVEGCDKINENSLNLLQKAKPELDIDLID